MMRRWLVLIGGIPLVVLVAIPLIALLARSNPHLLWSSWNEPTVSQALHLSLKTSGVSLGITVVFGTPLAYALARYRFVGRQWFALLIDLPLVLPPAVAGIALLLTFGRRGLLGQYFEAWGIQIAFTEVAVVLAQTFVAAPHYVKSAQTSFFQLDRELEEAAEIDGATPWRRFWLISAPLCWPGLFGGAVSTWARALGEFGATIIVAGNLPGRTQTMPLAIYLGFERNATTAITLALLLLLTSLGVLGVARWIVGSQSSGLASNKER